MSEIVITADSTCDLSKELTDKYNIEMIPLYVVYGDKAKKDGVETNPNEIYDYVEKNGELTKTSAVPMGEYLDYFKKFSEGGKTVIHFSISSGFSSTCNNAKLAAEELENVYVVDSLNLSTGSGLLVIKARELANEGKSAEEIVEEINRLTAYADASFIICNLDYLRMGGRCSTVAAIGANILKLKPCIEVIDGKMTVGKKYRGTFVNCLKEYIRERLEGNIDDIDTSRIFITHTRCDDEIEGIVEEEIKKYGNFDEILKTEAGSTVACHCGPETLGILYMRKTPKVLKK